ncbi:hypothetical protein [Clostridium sp. CCUG 7971]|uniref:hypothetical protein n=1 Tax=Clostridium sp. CCUG 7971 TaxID=2811414 RepID=UPI001ABB0C1B|nr:hypothetical protein [Clostridium sp. CCUG 7971]MBO3445133.1 hypothetical protein [Clostridium sp. CCUG 7971]
MKLEIGTYILDIDKDVTKNFYKSYYEITKNCNCASCRNYLLAINNFPIEIKYLFEKLGIEMDKAAEVYIPYKDDNGLLIYDGFYHISGSILTFQEVFTMINIREDFSVGFRNECNLVPKTFPTPVIEMSFRAKLPWLLNEKNTY